jgi:HNH endonuclease
MTRRMFNQKERRDLYLAADGKCRICGESLPNNWHADHIHPYSKGGKTDLANGQALCPTCNAKKSNSTDRIDGGAQRGNNLAESGMKDLREIYKPSGTRKDIYFTDQQIKDMDVLFAGLEAKGVNLRDNRDNQSISRLFRYLIEKELNSIKEGQSPKT